MIGSTLKTVSPVSSRGPGVPGGGCESSVVVFRRRISRAFQGLSQEILATPGIRAIGTRVASTQADAPQGVVRACFGEAAVAGFNKGKPHFLVLGKFCKVAMEDNVFAFGSPELGVKVTHLAAEAFLFSRASEARMAESAVSSPNRRFRGHYELFSTIIFDKIHSER